jgi:antitoxin VapB
MSRVVTDVLRERYAQIEEQRGKAFVEELLAIADRAKSI